MLVLLKVGVEMHGVIMSGVQSAHTVSLTGLEMTATPRPEYMGSGSMGRWYLGRGPFHNNHNSIIYCSYYR